MHATRMCDSTRREILDVGAQRVAGEALFPQPWRELGDLAGRMLSDPLQYIDEIGVGINAVQSAGNDQTLDDADVLGAEFGPAE